VDCTNTLNSVLIFHTNPGRESRQANSRTFPAKSGRMAVQNMLELPKSDCHLDSGIAKQVSTGRMLLLSPNQQRESTEEIKAEYSL